MQSVALGPQDEQSERIRRVASFADEYIRGLRSSWHPALLRTSWWDALRFWFGRSFYQGRLDKVSVMFERRALSVIEESLGSTQIDALRALTQGGLVEGDPFDEGLKTAGLPKRYDRLMVIDSLNFVSRLPNANIVAYSLERITAGHMEDLFDELDALRSVGEKIVSFYLRDLDFLFDLAA
jgi:hypothetical protein